MSGTPCTSNAPDVVRHGERRAPVQEDLDDLVVVPVRGQHQRGDVRREGGRVRRDRLPTLQKVSVWASKLSLPNRRTSTKNRMVFVMISLLFFNLDLRFRYKRSFFLRLDIRNRPMFVDIPYGTTLQHTSILSSGIRSIAIPSHLVHVSA